MSVRVMSGVFEMDADSVTSTQRLILLALGVPFVRYLAGRGFNSRDVLLGLSAAFGAQLTDALLISMGTGAEA